MILASHLPKYSVLNGAPTHEATGVNMCKFVYTNKPKKEMYSHQLPPARDQKREIQVRKKNIFDFRTSAPGNL